MSDLVATCRVLGDDTRWRIVRLVRDEALCVCELADILGMPQSSVSSHVQVIRKAGLLESERRGKWTYFRIGSHHLKLIRMLEKFFDGKDERIWATDARKAEKRLEVRDGSCCPGPVELKTRRRPQTKSTTC